MTETTPIIVSGQTFGRIDYKIAPAAGTAPDRPVYGNIDIFGAGLNPGMTRQPTAVIMLSPSGMQVKTVHAPQMSPVLCDGENFRLTAEQLPAFKNALLRLLEEPRGIADLPLNLRNTAESILMGDIKEEGIEPLKSDGRLNLLPVMGAKAGERLGSMTLVHDTMPQPKPRLWARRPAEKTFHGQLTIMDEAGNTVLTLKFKPDMLTVVAGYGDNNLAPAREGEDIKGVALRDDRYLTMMANMLAQQVLSNPGQESRIAQEFMRDLEHNYSVCHLLSPG